MDVLAYLDRSIATYGGDPPANDYQRGHFDALKVARAELGASIAAIRAGRAIEDIAAERRRQIESEGWMPEHDDEHSVGELAVAAACYAAPQGIKWPSREEEQNGVPIEYANALRWPWNHGWWKPGPDRRRELIKAGALIIAEIERLDRAAIGEARAV